MPIYNYYGNLLVDDVNIAIINVTVGAESMDESVTKVMKSLRRTYKIQEDKWLTLPRPCIVPPEVPTKKYIFEMAEITSCRFCPFTSPVSEYTDDVNCWHPESPFGNTNISSYCYEDKKPGKCPLKEFVPDTNSYLESRGLNNGEEKSNI